MKKKKNSKKKQTNSNLKDQEIRSNKKFCEISTFCIWNRSNYWHNNIFIQ